ncbi:hypothetical protein BGZ76_002052 [Entomortierella beljakovae]|nr:hypothetical protein BGZ76_002052 [Entomortierella beljakovae]
MDNLVSSFQQVQIQSSDVVRSSNELTQADTLIRTLYGVIERNAQNSSGRRRNLVNASTYDIDLSKNKPKSEATPSKLTVTSWKMNEFEYSKGNLPTLARGLFTYHDSTVSKSTSSSTSTSASTQDGEYRILIRGYDKFFNVGEVESTRPQKIAEGTVGPFEVTLKENGCIIFMSGLPPDLIGPQGGCVVTSKHSLGALDPIENVNQPDVSHSLKGQEWLEKSLASKGRTLQEFGLWLWNNNLTAVAELCDDEFEEHVLRYTGDRAGLYLHGLNKNTAEFQTLPSEAVQNAAREWGMRETDYLTFKTHKEVTDFADEVRNTCEYDNRAVEGFVIRCKQKQNGKTFFYKIKYDEPYLMYREWREVTKHLWSLEHKKMLKKIAQSTQPKKLRMKYPLTKLYVEFVTDLMKKEPELFVNYNKNQGIIAVRDMFLKDWESMSAKTQESLVAEVSGKKDELTSNSGTVDDFQRTVIIPIATIGCGKTTVSVALSKLFGWKHISSDDFHHFRKSGGQKFIQEIVKQLDDHTVVIADRNNFQTTHRERIMSNVLEKYPKTRFVALFWSHDNVPVSEIREMEIQRVKSRGSNHQCMTPEYCPDYELVIQRFLKLFEGLNPMVEPDSKFAYVVEAKAGEESLKFVNRIIQEFVIPVMGAGRAGNAPIPSKKEIDEAVKYALEDWKPERVVSGEVAEFHTAKESSDKSDSKPLVESSASSGASLSRRAQKARAPKYYAVSLEEGAVYGFINGLLEGGPKPKESSEWTKLREVVKAWNETNRIISRQHVTLIHASALKDPSPSRSKRASELWKSYEDEIARAGNSSSPTSPESPVISLPNSPMPSHNSDDGGFTVVSKKSNRSKKNKKEKASVGSEPASNPERSVSLASVGSTASTGDAALTPPELMSIVSVDHIIWTERIMALRVTSAKRVHNGVSYETTNAYLHATVATVGDHVKPFESNEMLRQWNQMSKHGAPSAKNTDVEIYSVKLKSQKEFPGTLRAMRF